MLPKVHSVPAVASPEVVLETLKGFQADVMGRLDSMERAIKENTTRLQLLYDIVASKTIGPV